MSSSFGMLHMWFMHEGESMIKGANRAKVKVLSKDCFFHMPVFNWFTLHFSHNFLKLNIKFEAKYDI
jgi:hypothetical protein